MWNVVYQRGGWSAVKWWPAQVVAWYITVRVSVKRMTGRLATKSIAIILRIYCKLLTTTVSTWLQRSRIWRLSWVNGKDEVSSVDDNRLDICYTIHILPVSINFTKSLSTQPTLISKSCTLPINALYYGVTLSYIYYEKYLSFSPFSCHQHQTVNIFPALRRSGYCRRRFGGISKLVLDNHRWVHRMTSVGARNKFTQISSSGRYCTVFSTDRIKEEISTSPH